MYAFSFDIHVLSLVVDTANRSALTTTHMLAMTSIAEYIRGPPVNSLCPRLTLALQLIPDDELCHNLTQLVVYRSYTK